MFYRAALLTAAITLATSAAWARSYHVSKFSSTIHVDQDGSSRVTEQITFVFAGQYQGVYRSIPVDYPGPGNSNYSLFIKIDGVSDENGQSLKYEKSTSNGFLRLKIYVPGAVDTSRTVNIEYSVANATKFFDSHDEFYWNVNGNDWTVPMDSVSAVVYFPGQTAGSLRAQAFTGFFGSKEAADATVEGAVVGFESRRRLGEREGLTLDVYIPKGLLQEPGLLTKAAWFLRSNSIVTLPVWAFVVMFAFWWTKGRDPDPGISVAPMYAPPEGMGPAEAGTLVAENVAPRDITAVLVDLAVRGYVKIVEVDHKGLLLHSKDYEFHLLKQRDQWTDVTDYERAMLDKIFGIGGTVTKLSELRNHFYTVLPMVKDEIIGALKSKGMYTVDPESAAGYWVAAAIVVVAPYVLLQLRGWANFLASLGPTIVCGLIALLIVFLFGRQLTATSLKGARTRVQILGFQEFMNRVDADRLKRMPPDTFEKFLPYAMALGVEHRWAKAFEGIVQNPPTWYQGTNGTMFNSIFFVNSLGSMSQQATAAFVSAPRASSSSSGWSGGGFSGGGFSGGGFGGGGGGAF